MHKADFSEKVSVLDFSNQGLSILPDLHTQTHLQELKAEHNSLTSLSKIPSTLKYLFLNHNRIAFVGNLDQQVPYLNILDLSGNRLISLDGIAGCTELRELNIANNYVGDDQIGQIRNLGQVRKLDISHNHLRDQGLLAVLKDLKCLEEL